MNRMFHFTKESRRTLSAYAQGVEDPGQPESEGGLVARPDHAALTHTGKVRPTNQDALVVSESLQLYGVADGMGGHKGGETASTGARDAVLAALEGKKPGVEALRAAIEAANTALYLQQDGDANLSGMGTTLSLIWMGESDAYLAHVGDSRIYRLRDGKLAQMTHDHSLVAELLRKGVLTREQAENHPMRNVITRAVGTEVTIETDLSAEERRAGDLWLICSDGLHGLVSDEEMEQALRKYSPEKAADVLLKAALEAGGRDNISVVVLLDREGGR